MRIISGRNRGKRIIAPTSLPVRPTTDFAKEALFNILNNQLAWEGLQVLDLFCGTGNISYEFASRGAGAIWSVDQNHGCVRFVTATAKSMEMEQIRGVRNDCLKFLKVCRIQFDVIFADPPFDFKSTDKIPLLIFENELLHPDGLLVVEHGRETDLKDVPHFVECRKYGKVHFSFFKKEE